MADKVVVEGEASINRSNQLPAVAKAYVLRFIKTEHPHLWARNEMEIQVLATILDHLATGRPSHAADVAAQQLTATDQSLKDGGSWGSAKYLQLIDLAEGLVGHAKQRVDELAHDQHALATLVG